MPQDINNAVSLSCDKKDCGYRNCFITYEENNIVNRTEVPRILEISLNLPGSMGLSDHGTDESFHATFMTEGLWTSKCSVYDIEDLHDEVVHNIDCKTELGM